MGAVDASAADAPRLGAFLKTLFETGQAMVDARPLADDSAGALAGLSQLDAHTRAELGLDTPPLSTPAALWAAHLFYHLCQFTVCRDLGEDQVNAVCQVPCPEPRGPSV